jgi:hypothetical protein
LHSNRKCRPPVDHARELRTFVCWLRPSPIAEPPPKCGRFGGSGPASRRRGHKVDVKKTELPKE